VEAGAAVDDLDAGELLLDEAAEGEGGDGLEEGAGEADDAGLAVGAEEVQAGAEVGGDEVTTDLAEPRLRVRDVRDVGELVAAEGEEFVLAGAEGAAPGGLGEEPLADLGLDAGQVGWAGAGQQITDVAQAEARQAGTIVEDDGEGFQKIVDFLAELKVI